MSGIRNLADNVSSISSNVQSQIDLKAPLASPNLTSPVTIDGNNTSPFTGFKNYIINGGFDVNQRIISLSDGYQVDRWTFAGNAQLSNLYIGNISGETTNNKALIFTKSGSGDNWISQRIEFPRRFAGKTVTVSFKAYSNTTMSGNVYFDVYNPTNGTTNSFGGAQSFSYNQSWNKRSFTFTIPAMGTNYDAASSYLQLNISCNGATTGAYLGEVQLEQGTVATPFEQRPYGLELSLCQRYYEVITRPLMGFSTSVDSAHDYFDLQFAVQKRVAPTLTCSSWTSGTVVFGSFGIYGCELYGSRGFWGTPTITVSAEL